MKSRALGRRRILVTPALRTAALLAILFASACSNTAQATLSAAPSAPSSAASVADVTADESPSYGLVNDTSQPVSVTGCGPACPRAHLAPDAQLDFAIDQGRVSIQLADGTTTCMFFMNGVRQLTPLPRQIFRISKNTSAESC